MVAHSSKCTMVVDWCALKWFIVGYVNILLIQEKFCCFFFKALLVTSWKCVLYCFLAPWMLQEGMKHNKICCDGYPTALTDKNRNFWPRHPRPFLGCVPCSPTLIRDPAGHVRHTQLGYWREFNEGPFFQGVDK